MKKLIVIALLGTLSLLTAMQMQTVQTKKIVVGTFDNSDTLNRAKQTLAQNSVLQRIQQQNNFLMTTRTNAGRTTLILEKFKTLRMALNAFVAVSKHYPKAYLLDDSYRVAVETPQPVVKPPHSEAPIVTSKNVAEPLIPTITETVVTAVATAETKELPEPVPEVLPHTTTSESNATETDDEPLIIVVTEAGSEAERRAIERALKKKSAPQPKEDEEEVVITEIEEIPLEEPNTTVTAAVTEEITQTDNTTVTASTAVDDRYKRKQHQKEESFLSTSTIIYILIAVVCLLLLLLWRRSRDVDIHKILGEQHRH